ncbi:DUF4129 domain-containing protein [Belliella marina]|uniref:DUF4129 domain-containing protein n=1 Tax=Belliella marina TaxID=1644146 RepID=A0ABW4VM71_9BACT
MKLKISILLLLFSISMVEAKQDSLSVEAIHTVEDLQPFEFGEEYLDRYLGDRDFQYDESDVGENWFQKLQRKAGELYSRFWRWIIGNRTAGAFLNFIIQILPYLVLIGLSILLVWLFVRYDNRRVSENKLNGNQVAFGSDEEIIQNQNIQQLINEAIARNDFRLAIRYYYLLTLKKLIERELIDWKIQKTNHDYFDELATGDLKNQFVEITKIYDYIWYGDFHMNQTAFNRAEGAFLKVDSLL